MKEKTLATKEEIKRISNNARIKSRARQNSKTANVLSKSFHWLKILCQ